MLWISMNGCTRDLVCTWVIAMHVRPTKQHAICWSGYVFTAMLRPNRGLLDSAAVGRYPAALQLTGMT
jgi:hypothetical protein